MAEVSEQPEAVIEEALDTFGNRFPTSCDTMIPVESYEFLIDLQVELGNLEEAFPVEDFLDTSVCAEAEQLLDEEGPRKDVDRAPAVPGARARSPTAPSAAPAATS